MLQQHRCCPLPPHTARPLARTLLPAQMHPTCTHDTCTRTRTPLPLHARTPLPPLARSQPHTPHACTTTPVLSLARQHSHLHLHAAATARSLALPPCTHTATTPSILACLHPAANLHPATRICTLHARTCNWHACCPRPLEGQISGEGGDGDLLGGARPQDGGDWIVLDEQKK
jgi:hypothetical protein